MAALARIISAQALKRMPAPVLVTGVIVAVLAIPGLLYAFFPVVFNPLHGHPTDQQLLDNYHAHAADFDELLQMFQHDGKLEAVAAEYTIPADPRTVGVPPERIARYRALFKTLRLEIGVWRGDNDEVWFYASGVGLFVPGSNKGYYYSSMAPASLVDSLDQYGPRHDPVRPAFRHIVGRWYLYYDYES